MSFQRLKTVATAIVAVGALLVAAACSSSGSETSGTTSDDSAPTSTPTDSGEPAGDDTAGDAINIEIITHASPGDTFWDVVKSGAMQAGGDLGVNVNYQGDGSPTAQSQLIDAAIAGKPDGIVVSMANPDGVRDAVQRAVAADIPVIVINVGVDEYKEFGAQTYVGQTEYVAGQGMGEKLEAEGLKNVLCVIHEAGNIGLEDRCRGVTDEMSGTVTNIQVDNNNVADAQNVIKSALLADTTIDGVVSLNPPITPAANQAIEEATSDAKLAAFGISEDVLNMIVDGKVLFAVDQQQYLQGYLPVVFLTLQMRNGDVVGGGHPVFTGPGFVTPDNAADILRFAKNGTR